MGFEGAAVALSYGYNWLTGNKVQSQMLYNTGNSNLDYTRIGFWVLGEGEMDGLVEMWDTGLGRLLATNEYDNTNWLHFHSGSDALAGGGFAQASIGGDQEVDSFWQHLPAGLQPLTYNRWAYYAIFLKQLINDPPNTNQYDPNNWADVNPIGLWRGIRCRLFDAKGSMVGYAFTRNPAWHYVDLLCRRKLFPEYRIDKIAGPDDLPSAVRNRFDFGALYESATYFGELLSNGMQRFSGDYSFSQKTTLQACVSQILTCSRSFQRERAGQYSIVADQPRGSVFTFSRKNADIPVVTDADVHSAASMYTAKFRDLLVPSVAEIASIVCGLQQNPVVTTKNPHCLVANDYVVIGNTGTAYDTYWQVLSVPDTNGAPVYQFTLQSRGSNYPALVGDVGGLVGLRYSRFKQRSPQFQHKTFQLALGAVGVGIARQRNKRNKDTDFANCTWDQVARITKYQRGVELGPDVAAFVSPPRLTLPAPVFAADAAGTGALAVQVEPGDVITIDDTLSKSYAGLWEVMTQSVRLMGSSAGQGSSRTPQAGGIQFTLRPYSDANYPDENQGFEPGWPVVPVLPGNQSGGTLFPLADGDAVFFTGSLADSASFEMPDGFNAANMLCWASPQGYVEGNAHLHFIQDCDAYPTRKVALIYNDSAGTTWTGNVNYCGVAWRT